METIEFAERIAAASTEVTYEDLSQDDVQRVILCFVDWLGVALAASGSFPVKVLTRLVEEDGGQPQATALTGRKVTVAQAALINGAMSHTLDYDDVHMSIPGHPSVVLWPGLTALAEWRQASGREAIAAFAAGLRAACWLGGLIGDTHYAKGWHPTATLGAIGASVSAAKLLRLDSNACTNAIAIAATRAAGLRQSFGTMCKPLHAGHAAELGVQSARLALGGFQGAANILDGERGFLKIFAGDRGDITPQWADERATYLDGMLFKYHATCYFTHAVIDALVNLRPSLASSAIDKIQIVVHPIAAEICHFENPEDESEAKFSIKFAAAASICGIDLSAPDFFTQLAAEKEKISMIERAISIETKSELASTEATVVVSLVDGATYKASSNSGIPESNALIIESKIRQKFMALTAPLLGQQAAAMLLDTCFMLSDLPTFDPIFAKIPLK